MKYNTFTASREIHPGVRFQHFLLFHIKHDNSSFSQEFQEKSWFHMKITRNSLLYLKTPKKPIGFVAVFSPGPAGAPLLPKSTNFHTISPKWMWNVDESTEIAGFYCHFVNFWKNNKMAIETIRGVAKSEGWFSRNHMNIHKILCKWSEIMEFP